MCCTESHDAVREATGDRSQLVRTHQLSVVRACQVVQVDAGGLLPAAAAPWTSAMLT